MEEVAKDKGIVVVVSEKGLAVLNKGVFGGLETSVDCHPCLDSVLLPIERHGPSDL